MRYAGLNLVSVTLPFLLLSILASQLTEAAHASSMPLHRCLDKGSAADGDLREGRLLASQLRAPYVALTGWGFFAFSRSFVLTLAGALISYVVILLQLNPATNKAPVPVAGH
ncbi:hypothetical protein HPB48_008911 [Haemaphysalis longicornis]|uniref:Gustatory receptor n=1 Tax=Haemaphysalis longicornis TaxID=44386 RepID=A0A9J6FRQ3_HAELO|nr:hypothetical protein HPB48_008911 [Haemaphysalis longicornis]